MRSGKACASTSPRTCAGTLAAAAASQRRRRRHCFDAASIAASAERLASAPTRPLRKAASACQRSASASLRLRKGSRASSNAARSQASAMRCGSFDASSIAASRGWVPSASMRLPRAVIALPASSASSRCSRSRPAANAPAGGGSTKRSAALPQAASSSASEDSSTCAISGLRCGSSRCDCGHSRYAQPVATRPARPARWSAEACDTATTSSREKPLFGSKRGSRASPLSITTRTPGKVTLDSATLVASTTRRRPSAAGCSTRVCCSIGSSPCRARISVPSPACAGEGWGGVLFVAAEATPSRPPPAFAGRGDKPCSRADTFAISRCPGRNTSTSPGCVASTCSIARFAWCSSASSRRAGKCATSTG